MELADWLSSIDVVVSAFFTDHNQTFLVTFEFRSTYDIQIISNTQYNCIHALVT